MKAVCNSNIDLPTVKVVIVPGEQSPSLTAKTATGCHVVYNDILSDFESKWMGIINELKAMKVNNPVFVC